MKKHYDIPHMSGKIRHIIQDSDNKCNHCGLVLTTHNDQCIYCGADTSKQQDDANEGFININEKVRKYLVRNEKQAQVRALRAERRYSNKPVGSCFCGHEFKTQNDLENARKFGCPNCKGTADIKNS